MDTKEIKAIIESFTGANDGYQSVGEDHFDELAKELKEKMYEIKCTKLHQTKKLILKTTTNGGDKAKLYISVIGTSKENAALHIKRLTLTKNQKYFGTTEQKPVKLLDSATFLFRTRFSIRLDTLQLLLEMLKINKIVK